MEWISVNDSMPSDGQCAIVFDKSGVHGHIYIMQFSTYSIACINGSERRVNPFSGISHWMPLPPAP